MKIRYKINNPMKNEKLQQGDSIKFCSGPFTNLIAKVESVEGIDRIWVLLEAVGRFKRLKLQNFEKKI
jgi:transcription antitermination factor NusG